MRMRIGGAVFLLMMSAGIAGAQTNEDASWVGIWHAELDGQPSAVLTLAEDNGPLEGTLVLNGISHDGGQPRIAVRETHVLMHPRMDGKTFSFQVKRKNASNPLMNFTVVLAAEGTATLRCLNCGVDAPVAEMTEED